MGNLVPRQQGQPVTQHVPDMLALPPNRLIGAATEMANVLKKVVDGQKLYSMLNGKKHVNVEGWTTLGSLMGITPREVDVTELKDGSYTASVELYNTRTGQVVGRGSALCGREEKTWRNKPRYQVRSMAITRATGKAYRLSFSWIMSLAGYAVTPLEEMAPNDQPIQENKPSTYEKHRANINPTPPPPPPNIPQNDNGVSKSAQQDFYYDDNNDQHMERLEKHLKARKDVPDDPELWIKIAKKFHGKHLNDLGDIIKQVLVDDAKGEEGDG